MHARGKESSVLLLFFFLANILIHTLTEMNLVQEFLSICHNFYEILKLFQFYRSKGLQTLGIQCGRSLQTLLSILNQSCAQL